MPTVTARRGASNDGELRITLDRPETMNAWTPEFGRELLDGLREAAGDPSVRLVTITGAGRAFSSGADLSVGFEPNADGHPDVQSALDEVYNPIIAAVRELPKPVVAAVNGPAVGIGLSLALACDLVIARESAFLMLAFVNIGLVPDGGASLFVPARVGLGRATEMAMLGERIPARQALEWGLVNRVVPDEDFDRAVDELAERLATGPTRSYAGIKRQLNAWLLRGIEEQLQLEAAVQQELAASADFAEGVQAFRAKRRAEFGGA